MQGVKITVGCRSFRRTIRARGHTIMHVAELTGVEPVTVWRWCRGRTVPRLHDAFEIERVYGIPAKDWLMPV
jgi:transcriptional regulator with XRE-family HTH domain